MSKARQPQRLSHRISKIVNRHQLQSLGLTSLMALATGVMVMVATSLIFTATAGAQFSKSPSLAVPGQAASGLDLPEIRWQDAQGNPDLPDAQNTTIVDQVKTVQHIQNRPDAVGLKGLLDALDSPHQLTRRKAAHALARQIIDQYRSQQVSTLMLKELSGYAEDHDPVVKKNVLKILDTMQHKPSATAMEAGLDAI